MNDRVKIFRERQTAKGLKQVSFWLDAATETLLKHVTEASRLQSGEVVGRALAFWQERNGNVSEPVTEAANNGTVDALTLEVHRLAARVAKLEELANIENVTGANPQPPPQEGRGGEQRDTRTNGLATGPNEPTAYGEQLATISSGVTL